MHPGRRDQTGPPWTPGRRCLPPPNLISAPAKQIHKLDPPDLMTPTSMAKNVVLLCSSNVPITRGSDSKCPIAQRYPQSTLPWDVMVSPCHVWASAEPGVQSPWSFEGVTCVSFNLDFKTSSDLKQTTRPGKAAHLSQTRDGSDHAGPVFCSQGQYRFISVWFMGTSWSPRGLCKHQSWCRLAFSLL